MNTPEKRTAIKNAVIEASGSKQMISDRQSHIKDITDMVKEKYEISPKIFRKMVDTHFKQNFSEIEQTNGQFSELYSDIFLESDTEDETE